MQKRVYGLETEYGFIILDGDSDYYSYCYSGEILGAFYSAIKKEIEPAEGDSDQNFFYLNGARIYQDTGQHPEYATPECGNIKDLIKWDKAGERIFEEAMLIANSQFHNQLYFYKNNRDAEISTFGCHENYLLRRVISSEYLRNILIPFLVTRQIICGAGYVARKGFFISQRADYITDIASGSATQGRGIFNVKDETLADSQKWRRLHLILGDANMSQIAGFLKVGTTALVLQMAEDEFFSDNKIALDDPVLALKIINADPSCREEVKLSKPLTPTGSRFISAVEIQEIYLNWAKEYLEGFGSVKPEWLEIVQKWERTLELLKENPMNLYREIDWVAKKWLMESLLAKYHCDWQDIQNKIIGTEPEEEMLFELLKMTDFLYHDIRRDVGLYNLLEKEGIMETLVAEEEIQKAKTEPPANTRAKWRSEFIKMAKEGELKPLIFLIHNWDDVAVHVSSEAYQQKEVISTREGPNSSFYSRHFHNDNPFDNRPTEPAEILRELQISISRS